MAGVKQFARILLEVTDAVVLLHLYLHKTSAVAKVIVMNPIEGFSKRLCQRFGKSLKIVLCDGIMNKDMNK